jgi:DNA processing protein
MTGPPPPPPVDPDSRQALIALSSLPSLSPRRLWRMLVHHPPVDLWERIRAGAPLSREATKYMHGTTMPRLLVEAQGVDAARVIDSCERAGARILVRGDLDFPALLAHDLEPATVIFIRGRLSPLHARRVGIVGTRNATAAGRATAFELGEALAGAGITVVSGLARGIDGAAHRGVRDVGGAPVAVVGSGIDVPYPLQHRDLWEWVAAAGLLLSEWPPGVEADAWHFPVRNRVVAALSEVLVVVESRERGGSLITAAEAMRRDMTVLAVPGSIRCRASAGTNTLLNEGNAQILTCFDDVLVALGLDTRRARGEVPERLRSATSQAAAPHTLEARVFALCADRPCTLDDLVRALDVGVASVAFAAARLEREGWLVDSGGWFEPAGSKLGAP